MNKKGKEDNMFMDDIIQFIPNIYLAALKYKDREKVNVDVLEDAMVTSAVMVDRLLPEGVFHKNSGVKVAEILLYLRTKNSNRGTLLIRQLKFGSIHFNDETTPKSVRNMF